MEGPTPVSALIHAATMVAAGVYLVGRFFPVFTPQGPAGRSPTSGASRSSSRPRSPWSQTDIKRVLAYSTVSQLGYMMLALGVAAVAGGAVPPAHARLLQGPALPRRRQRDPRVHTNEMPGPGGAAEEDADHGALRCWSAPWRSRASRSSAGSTRRTRSWRRPSPGSGDSPEHFLLFLLPAVGATITAFYMFRMWFLTVRGRARGFKSEAAADSAHEHDDEHHLAEQETAHGHGRHEHDLKPGRPCPRERPIMTGR